MRIYFKHRILLSALILGLLCTNVVVAEAKEQSINVTGQCYSFGEKDNYDVSAGKESDSSISPLGVFRITGDVKAKGKNNGVEAYIVSGDKLSLSYDVADSALNSDDSKWHLIDVKDKAVDGLKLDKDVLSGAVIIQTSLTGENWITSEEYSDVFDVNKGSLNNLYDTKDIQLQNGCYYRILVVYGQERTVGENKVAFIKTDKKENRKVAEEYVFFAESKNKGQMTSPNSSPKKIYGKKGDASTAVNTGKDKGYCLSKGGSVLSSDDPQYGWALGYFTINGYTSDVKDNDGNYIFLKNVGDQVTLWFTLEKDINDLKGDGRLSIAEDDNGEDLDFQINKTNFKHGTLIIRHLDSENGSKSPIIYTDYLAANARTEANTKVTLFEEGDYEVALDYEIKNEPRKVGSLAVVPEYTDYKIYFKFSIRNGNCMAYPFDNKTGSELRDGDICEEGFTIKLAGSKYNDVTVKYDVVVGEDGQKKYDTRKNATAKEGGAYTDEGVYTFSVTNQYTGVTSSKTVYVGTDPYLKALSKTGRTLNEINDKIQQGYELLEDGSLVLPIITPEPTEEPTPEPVEEPSIDIEPSIAPVEVEEEPIIEYVTEEESGDTEANLDEVEETEVKNTKFPIVPVLVFIVVLCGAGFYVYKTRKPDANVTSKPEEEETK